MNPNPIPPIAIGCSSSTSVLGNIFDSAGQGMVYGALLNPPIDGLALSSRGILCGNNFNDPINLVVRQSAFHPGASYTTNLSITPAGPPPQKSMVFGLSINVVPIDFDIDPVVLDFGNVTIGQYRRQALTVANAATSAPFDILYSSPQQKDPFLLLSLPMGQSLQPGGSVEMLEASINPQVPGNYEATFLVSTFPHRDCPRRSGVRCHPQRRHACPDHRRRPARAVICLAPRRHARRRCDMAALRKRLPSADI